jgi:hypothetical protein
MGFYSRLFLVPKKGGDLRPLVIDLSNLNQFISNENFQMENILCLKQLLNPNDFMVKLDLRRLPNSGHSRGLSTIPSVYMEGPNIPVSSPAIRVVHGPKNIHETSQTCHSVPSYAEHSAPHLSGRYSNCRFKYNSLEQTHATGFRA